MRSFVFARNTTYYRSTSSMTRSPRMSCEQRIIGESCSLPFCSLIVNASLTVGWVWPVWSLMIGCSRDTHARIHRIPAGFPSAN